MIVDRYYYHQLNKQEQAIYKVFYKGVMSHQEIIPIRCVENSARRVLSVYSWQ